MTTDDWAAENHRQQRQRAGLRTRAVARWRRLPNRRTMTKTICGDPSVTGGCVRPYPCTGGHSMYLLPGDPGYVIPDWRKQAEWLKPVAGCPQGCPQGECYCEPAGGGIRSCGHGDGLQGCCTVCRGCIDCDACHCGED